MGRTLTYVITKDDGNFTKKEYEAILEISERYNSKEMLDDINKAYKTKLKKLWSCENFYLGIGNFYPNYDKFKKENIKDEWKVIENRISELEKTMSEIDAILQVKKEGLILFHDETYKKSLGGFTKTQRNEFNSLLVFKALIEISKRVPKATLHLSDEGELLFCPLKIKNGLVLPEISNLIESIQYYSMLMMLSPSYEKNILKTLKNTEFKNECFKQDIYIENSYGDMSKYIDNKLRNLQEIEKVLMKELKQEYDFYLYNINNRSPKDWFKPELFIRPVNVEKFLKYECSASTMMDGFEGQGFGITDVDGESESYKMMAKMFRLIEKAGLNKLHLKSLGTDY